MTDKDFNNEICNNEQRSTEKRVELLGIQKKYIKKGIGCNCQKFRGKNKLKIQSPNKSSNECDGWKEEDNFNRKLESRREQKEFTDLLQYASKLQCVINIARQQLKELEESIKSKQLQN